jgi:hypothetical protein
VAATFHPWFRFSLRTLFVFVTAICCYLGWEINIVRQRQTVLRELRNQSYLQVTTAEAWKNHLISGGWKGAKPAEVPMVRKWLGDEAIQEIACGRGHHRLSQEQFHRLPKLFPEATVHEYEVLAVPCHPGCFPLGTLVRSPQGLRRIEEIQVGDSLTAFRADGCEIVAQVQSVFVTTNYLWKIETDEGSLLTTQAQPLCSTIDRPIRAGDLKPGDQVLRYDNGKIYSVNVHTTSSTDRVVNVINLVLGDSELFIANGYLARSKPPAE